MEYEEIKLLKQSEKSMVHLVRKKGGEQVFVRKILKGQCHIYLTLESCRHPYLPELFEVSMSDDVTEVIEEYVEGQSLGSAELSEKQLLSAFKELCSVLEYLHGRDIIHRDIKPSNIILAKDGHIRLIDFDAARMPKDDLEQDTRLLGTRGYAPPEQYGFAQTDARADIYALGVTMKQLLGDKALKPHYRRIIQRCINLNPDNRYQSARQVKRAFSCRKYCVLGGLAVLLLLMPLWINMLHRAGQHEDMQSESMNVQSESENVQSESMNVQSESENMKPENADVQLESDGLVVLPAPDAPHWDGETGVAVWGNVPESGTEEEVVYYWRVYKKDTATPPDLMNDTCYREGRMAGNGGRDKNFSTYYMNLASELYENGFYYFAVSAVGDGIHYADSPYAISDAFEYTGESAPFLPTPTGLAWLVTESNGKQQYYATWSNLSDYADTDSFNVCIYDEAGDYVTNNIWEKKQIMSIGHDGIWISPELLGEAGHAYRFTVQAYTSRPNEYQSSLMPEPVPEEYFSPWLTPDGKE